MNKVWFSNDSLKIKNITSQAVAKYVVDQSFVAKFTSGRVGIDVQHDYFVDKSNRNLVRRLSITTNNLTGSVKYFSEILDGGNKKSIYDADSDGISQKTYGQVLEANQQDEHEHGIINKTRFPLRYIRYKEDSRGRTRLVDAGMYLDVYKDPSGLAFLELRTLDGHRPELFELDKPNGVLTNVTELPLFDNVAIALNPETAKAEYAKINMVARNKNKISDAGEMTAGR
ncbi:MAG: hypothetical protein FWE53_05140 [Firmicutes bacterium]|nr:hypothetical protein [Bacillota bacterium]